jgi:hypothetical protein
MEICEQDLIAEGDLLANYVDTTVVSANSNSARIMMVRAGPKRVLKEHRMRSVDIYVRQSFLLDAESGRTTLSDLSLSFANEQWHPLQAPPFKGQCDGEVRLSSLSALYLQPN